MVELEYYELQCPSCKGHFKVTDEYECVITCPYCGELVEQP